MVAIAWKGSFLIEKGKLGSMTCSLPYVHTVQDKYLLLLTLQGEKIPGLESHTKEGLTKSMHVLGLLYHGLVKS